MSLYATFDQIRRRGLMKPNDVDAIEQVHPGLVLERATEVSNTIDTRLVKRYQTPFRDPPPDIVSRWTIIITSFELLVDIRGINPDSNQYETAKQRYDTAWAQVQEAADEEKGLFELPLRQSQSGLGPSAINAGGPYAYAEPGPYEWMDHQAEAVAGRNT